MNKALLIVTALGPLAFSLPAPATACCCMDMDDMEGMERGGVSVDQMGHGRSRATERDEALAANAPTSAVCPVGGMQIRVTEDTPATEFRGRTYYFCSEKEQREFLRRPERYAQR